MAGTLRKLVYIPGKFLNADLDKASEDNERQHFVVERADGLRIGFTQIAGLVARRIMPFVSMGSPLETGQRVGLIRFGSRVDVYLPAGTTPQVLLGQRTLAGRSEEHTSELQSLMRISYAVFCLKEKTKHKYENIGH